MNKLKGPQNKNQNDGVCGSLLSYDARVPKTNKRLLHSMRIKIALKRCLPSMPHKDKTKTKRQVDGNPNYICTHREMNGNRNSAFLLREPVRDCCNIEQLVAIHFASGRRFNWPCQTLKLFCSQCLDIISGVISRTLATFMMEMQCNLFFHMSSPNWQNSKAVSNNMFSAPFSGQPGSC
jgi:hypothetical protein